MTEPKSTVKTGCAWIFGSSKWVKHWKRVQSLSKHQFLPEAVPALVQTCSTGSGMEVVSGD